MIKSLEFLVLINLPESVLAGVFATLKVLASTVADWLLQGSTETRLRVQDVC